LVQRPEFSVFGLTDSAIVAAAPGKYLVLTKDFRLVAHLKKNGVDALNFTQLRAINLGF
jgi:hypothetical protein